MKGPQNPSLTDGRFEIPGQGFEIRQKCRVFMVFGDITDEGAADNDAVRKLGDIFGLFRGCNAKSDGNWLFANFLNGLYIFFDLV